MAVWTSWRARRGESLDSPALEPRDAYAQWAATYPPRPHNRLMEVEQAAVLELLPDVRSLTVLDAGCGTGRYLRLCADRGASVVGIDLSAPMLWYARDALSARRVRRTYARCRFVPHPSTSSCAGLRSVTSKTSPPRSASWRECVRPGGHRDLLRRSS